MIDSHGPHRERPGKEIVVSAEDRQEEEDLRDSGILVVDAVSKGKKNGQRFVGFVKAMKYGDDSRSTYQRAVRSHNGKVDMHYTTPYTAPTIERVTAVPMRPRANWRSELSAALNTFMLSDPGLLT